jgi:hypothetical protein
LSPVAPAGFAFNVFNEIVADFPSPATAVMVVCGSIVPLGPATA